jgi:hypothetical protein
VEETAAQVHVVWESNRDLVCPEAVQSAMEYTAVGPEMQDHHALEIMESCREASTNDATSTDVALQGRNAGA